MFSMNRNSMTTKSAKAKGRRLQNRLVGDLRKTFPDYPPENFRPALMGEKGADIKYSSGMHLKVPFAFEVKNCEQLNIWKALDQAINHTSVFTPHPAVVFSRNKMESYVAIPLDIFLRMVKEWTK